jgi:Flp pilus assembly protein TadG
LHFLTDTRGGVAPMFALALVPLIGLVGAAVDYSRGNAVRTAMQASLDATALMLSRDAADMDPSLVTSKATAYFKAQFDRAEMPEPVVTAVLSSPQQGSFILDVTASGTVPTTFTRIIGQEKLDISSSTQVKWGVKKLELALVLDNTGSMSSNGKMTELKTASKSLLTTLKNAAKELGDVKVAIVPFDKIVNIGTSYAGSGFIDYAVHNIQQSSWQGCVQDRDQPNDTLDTPPGASSNTKYPAVSCSGITSIMPLTDVLDSTGFTSLNSKIDAMNPADGNNTQNRWTTSGSSIDTRTAAACTNVKAANIKIYTIRVIDGDANLLRNCATKTSMYYEVNQASQLNSVFSSIAQTLANLRLAK